MQHADPFFNMTDPTSESLPEDHEHDSLDILSPDSFDWAEDMEDKIQSKFPQSSDPTIRLSDSISGFLPEEHEYTEDSDDLSDPESTHSEASSNTSEGSLLIIDGSSHQYPCTAFPSLQPNVQNELAYRNCYVKAEEGEEHKVHHFNWMGNPVYQHSSTPPTESLALILSEPKISQHSDEHRMQAILGCAFTFLDPVVVNLYDGHEDSLLQMRGSKLVQAANGRVFKYYTLHGQWTGDNRDQAGETALDDANPSTYYCNPDVAIGNGFVETSVLPSRMQYRERQDELAVQYYPNRKQNWWQPTPSRLRESMTIEQTPVSPSPVAIETPTTICKPVAAQKPAPSLKTVDPSRDPNIYYSFPDPGFEEPTRSLLLRLRTKKISVRKVLKQALTALGSAWQDQPPVLW